MTRPHRLNRGGPSILASGCRGNSIFRYSPIALHVWAPLRRPRQPATNLLVGNRTNRLVALQRVAPANILALCRGLEHRGVLNGGNHNGMPIGRGRSFSEPRVKTPNQCPRFAIRMKYRGGERITPLPLTQDMIRQLALEAGVSRAKRGRGELVRCRPTEQPRSTGARSPKLSGPTQFGNQRPRSEERRSRAGKA